MANKFVRADNSNLPRIDVMMVAEFFAKNPDFISAEFRNVKTVVSSKETYGDDAVGYVQLCRENDTCVVKCKMCPEHKVHNKQYNVSLTVNEKEAQVVSVICHDCVASAGGCKHSVAFLMWVHRRSEEPSCTSVQCYWKKPKLAQVGRTIKFVTAKEMSTKKSGSINTNNNEVLKLFLAEAKRRKVRNCQLLRYQPDYEMDVVKSLSLHVLSVKHNTEFDCEKFLNMIASAFRKEIICLVETETRDQHTNPLWFELRYARITASKAYEISQCKTPDGSLVQILMGARTPDTPAMKRGRLLEDKVRTVVECTLGKINKCGLFLSEKYPMIAASPDGIFCNDNEKAVIEIKCPTSEQTYKNYIRDGKISKKFLCQMQIQMYVTNTTKSFFCVADPDFENNSEVSIIETDYNETYTQNIINKVLLFWKTVIYPLLHRSTLID